MIFKSNSSPAFSIWSGEKERRDNFGGQPESYKSRRAASEAQPLCARRAAPGHYLRDAFRRSGEKASSQHTIIGKVAVSISGVYRILE